MMRLVQARSDLAHLYFVQFISRSETSPQLTSDSDDGPRTGPYAGWEGDVNRIISNYDELDRVCRACSQPMRWAQRERLSSCYKHRFHWLGDRKDIDKAIELCRLAMADSPPSDESYPEILSNLANCLCLKHSTYRRSEDLHEAILHIERVLELRPDNTIYRMQRAEMYHLRFGVTNNVSDLDAALSETRVCLNTDALQGPNRVVTVRWLASALQERFEIMQNAQDLGEAIEKVEELADEVRRGVTVRSNSDDWEVFRVYGDLLRRKFEVSGNIDDLHGSCAQYEMALQLVPRRPSDRRTILHNYANSLSALYLETKELENLNKSLDLYREASRLTGGNEVSNLYSFGMGLVTRVGHTHGQNNGVLDESANRDLDDAIKYLHDAENLVHPDHPSQTHIQDAMAQAYWYKGGSENQQIAFSLYERALARVTVMSWDRLRVARNWIKLALGIQDFKEATRAYGHAMDSLYRFLKRNPTATAQHRVINDWDKRDDFHSRTFSSDAAHAAIMAGDPMRAVELLEQGRGLSWTQLNHYRCPLDLLKETDPALAEKYEALSKQLESLDVPPNGSKTMGLVGRATEEFLVASKEWNSVVEQIRKLDGFSGFHKPLRYDQLRKAATGGPVIIVNFSARHRVMEAIIVRNGGDPVVVPLPNASPDRIVENCIAFTDSLSTLVGGTFDLPSARSGPKWWQSSICMDDRNDDDDDSDNDDSNNDDNDDSDDDDGAVSIEEMGVQRENVRHVLRFMWDSVVQPVVEKLQELSILPGSRIWWCPTSLVCVLPLHAAGPYKPGQHNLFDLYISSYMRGLSDSHHVKESINLRPKDEDTIAPTQLLAVSCPGELGDDDYLYNVEREVEEVTRCFASSVITSVPKVLDGPTADPDTIIAHLPHYPWVHFTCQGFQHPEPSRSFFQVYGGKKVTLLDFMKVRNPNAELAFLSACNTATRDTNSTSDEVTHFVSTLQFIGFKSVIGTLWDMYDADGPDLARDFYGYLLGEGKADYRMSAVALHHATKKMRERDVPLERWINFVHFGA